MNGKLEINILSHAESIIYAFEENNCSKECIKKYSHTSDLNHPNPRRTNERIPELSEGYRYKWKCGWMELA